MNSVAGIAFENGRAFIARRKAGGDLGGKWEFPGGKVEEGEGDADALKREFLEEFAVAVEAGPLLASAEFVHCGRGFNLNAYRVFFCSCSFRLAEHTEWRWATLDEIAELDFADSDRRLLAGLKGYFEGQGGVKN